MTMDADDCLLEGIVSIRAALESGWRPLHELLLDKRKRFDRAFVALRAMAEAAGLDTRFAPRAEIDRIASGTTHGGAIARAGERRFCGLEALLPERGPAFIAMLDGIEDPYNFAGAIRALYAAGVDGVVLRPRNWTSASGIVSRASAGASERLKLAIAENAAEAADCYRSRGLRVAAAAKTPEARSLYVADLRQPLFLLIGGERRGLTRSFQSAADIQLRVPYGREFDGSLGAVAAASAIAFEVARQRRLSRA